VRGEISNSVVQLEAGVVKSDAEKVLLKKAIEENVMFTCLDELQIATFIEVWNRVFRSINR
jgi:hypothetical protein